MIYEPIVNNHGVPKIQWQQKTQNKYKISAQVAIVVKCKLPLGKVISWGNQNKMLNSFSLLYTFRQFFYPRKADKSRKIVDYSVFPSRRLT